MIIPAYLLKELHVLPARSTLAKPLEPMCSRGIVNDDIEHLSTEEICHVVSRGRAIQGRASSVSATSTSFFAMCSGRVPAIHILCPATRGASPTPSICGLRFRLHFSTTSG
jgi:hypothetical protein